MVFLCFFGEEKTIDETNTPHPTKQRDLDLTKGSWPPPPFRLDGPGVGARGV